MESHITNSDLKSSGSHEKDSETSFDGQRFLLGNSKLPKMTKLDRQSSLKVTFEGEAENSNTEFLSHIHKKSFSKSASSVSEKDSKNRNSAKKI